MTTSTVDGQLAEVRRRLADERNRLIILRQGAGTAKNQLGRTLLYADPAERADAEQKFGKEAESNRVQLEASEAAVAALEEQEARLSELVRRQNLADAQANTTASKQQVAESRDVYQRQFQAVLAELGKLQALGASHAQVVSMAMAAISGKISAAAEAGVELYDPRTGGRLLSDAGAELQSEQRLLSQEGHPLRGYRLSPQDKDAINDFLWVLGINRTII